MISINDRSAGLPMLEVQHRQVLECLGRVKQTLDGGRGWDPVYFSLAALIKNFESCAAAEESIMSCYDFPESAHHKQEHADLLLSLQGMQKANLTTGLTRQLIAATVASAMEHHLTLDRHLARHLARSRGKYLCLSGI